MLFIKDVKLFGIINIKLYWKFTKKVMVFSGKKFMV